MPYPLTAQSKKCIIIRQRARPPLCDRGEGPPAGILPYLSPDAQTENVAGKGRETMAETVRMTRREGRERILGLLYAREFCKEMESGAFLTRQEENAEEEYPPFVRETFLGVEEKRATLDEEIGTAAVKWKLRRMGLVTRNILRLSVYEMTAGGVPAKAAINEAVELAKKYDEEQAPAFINGILNKIARDHALIE